MIGAWIWCLRVYGALVSGTIILDGWLATQGRLPLDQRLRAATGCLFLFFLLRGTWRLHREAVVDRDVLRSLRP